MADLQAGLQQRIDYAKALGTRYLVCAFPWTADSRFRNSRLFRIASGITLDDWKWNAEQLNKIGAVAAKAGLSCGYHNHNMEFRSYDGVVAYDELLRLTDPEAGHDGNGPRMGRHRRRRSAEISAQARRPHLDAAREGSAQGSARDCRQAAGTDHRGRQRQDRLEAAVRGRWIPRASATTSSSRKISSARRSKRCASASTTCAARRSRHAMRTIKGPAIFLAQFAGDAPPFNTLRSIGKWAAGLGFKARADSDLGVAAVRSRPRGAEQDLLRRSARACSRSRACRSPSSRRICRASSSPCIPRTTKRSTASRPSRCAAIRRRGRSGRSSKCSKARALRRIWDSRRTRRFPARWHGLICIRGRSGPPA